MLTKIRLRTSAICIATGVASAALAATGLPASLESKAKIAFADIAKAKAALNAGNTKTSQSYLAKSEGLLKTVLDRAPKSAGAKSAQSPAAQRQGTKGSAISQAEGEVAKLEPSFPAKVGAGENAAAETADGGTQGATQPAAYPSAMSTIGEIESAYQKVTLARTLLKGGNSSKAKSILDEIPSSPLGLLKSASGL
jgi:hypothetical protein